MVDRFLNWLYGLGDRFVAFLLHHADMLKDPESMVGAFIVTFWAVLAGDFGGVWTILIFLTIGLLLHGMAVETGNHVVLWLVTSALLLLIVIASETAFGGLSPIFLAAAATTALAHSELVRMNYTRRRNAVVTEAAFQASGLALAVAAAVGLAGVALGQLFAQDGGRSWLWMPVAVAALLLVGFGLAIGPTRRADTASKERWEPGARIPPQPLGREDLDHF